MTDFGKLGRGGSDGCSVPHPIERLNGLGIVQIECGAQFSLALTRSGEIWTWGKGGKSLDIKLTKRLYHLCFPMF